MAAKLLLPDVSESGRLVGRTARSIGVDLGKAGRRLRKSGLGKFRRRRRRSECVTARGIGEVSGVSRPGRRGTALTEAKPVACSLKPVPEKVAEVGVAVNVLLPDASDRLAVSDPPAVACAVTDPAPVTRFEYPGPDSTP